MTSRLQFAGDSFERFAAAGVRRQPQAARGLDSPAGARRGVAAAGNARGAKRRFGERRFEAYAQARLQDVPSRPEGAGELGTRFRGKKAEAALASSRRAFDQAGCRQTVSRRAQREDTHSSPLKENVSSQGAKWPWEPGFDPKSVTEPGGPRTAHPADTLVNEALDCASARGDKGRGSTGVRHGGSTGPMVIRTMGRWSSDLYCLYVRSSFEQAVACLV